LEEKGIGRPSTYAPTISTIINRGYVVKQSREGAKRAYTQLTLAKDKVTAKELTENVGKESGRLCPTDTGMLVNDYLETNFPAILDYNFTASVEKEFDQIAEGDQDWAGMIAAFYGPFHKTVEQALETAPQRTNTVRVLGTDPKTGGEVSARIGRFGPMAQITVEGEEKPRYASLKKGQLIASITLEEALELFALPRTVGQHEGHDVVIGIGKFGPYARWNGTFTSLAKGDDPYSVTLERAVELIEQKKAAGASGANGKTVIKSFPEDEKTQVLSGKYGPYIASHGKNYRIPKGTDPAALTIEACREIIGKKDGK
ncbi:MAG: DNA topoisomerase I, partial [Rikenellaceae bacterium]|nr:DNA topoisomerase I [Rikenellaceae bacterium]